MKNVFQGFRNDIEDAMRSIKKPNILNPTIFKAIELKELPRMATLDRYFQQCSKIRWLLLPYGVKIVCHH